MIQVVKFLAKQYQTHTGLVALPRENVQLAEGCEKYMSKAHRILLDPFILCTKIRGVIRCIGRVRH